MTTFTTLPDGRRLKVKTLTDNFCKKRVDVNEGWDGLSEDDQIHFGDFTKRG